MSSTISLLLNVFQTKSQHRRLYADYRGVLSNIAELTNVSVELEKGESFQVSAKNFVVLQLTESVKATVTTYSLVNDSYAANDPVELDLVGIFAYTGKILISINNPSDNVVDLPYHISAVYG